MKKTREKKAPRKQGANVITREKARKRGRKQTAGKAEAGMVRFQKKIKKKFSSKGGGGSHINAGGMRTCKGQANLYWGREAGAAGAAGDDF